MATIRKRQRKWQVQVSHIEHKQISKTFNRKQEAAQWARALEVSFDQNKLGHKVIVYFLKLSTIPPKVRRVYFRLTHRLTLLFRLKKIIIGIDLY